MTVRSIPGFYIQSAEPAPAVLREDTGIPGIPGIIGFSSQAIGPKGEDLTGAFFAVESQQEFEFYFGGDVPPEITEVKLDPQGQLMELSYQHLAFLYQSVRLFFENGGNRIWVCSLGPAPEQMDGEYLEVLEQALLKTRKIEEITLLLAPDAVLLPQESLLRWQKGLLEFCSGQLHKFALLDLKEDDAAGNIREGWEKGVLNFRQYPLGKKAFGAAFSPQLQFSWKRSFDFRRFRGKIKTHEGHPIADLSPFAESRKEALGYQEFADLLDASERLEQELDQAFQQLFQVAKFSNARPLSGTPLSKMDGSLEIFVEEFQSKLGINAGQAQTRFRRILRFIWFVAQEVVDKTLLRFEPANPKVKEIFGRLRRQVFNLYLTPESPAQGILGLTRIDILGNQSSELIGQDTFYPSFLDPTGDVLYEVTFGDGWNNTLPIDWETNPPDLNPWSSLVPIPNPSNDSERMSNANALLPVLKKAFQNLLAAIKTFQTGLEEAIAQYQRKVALEFPAFGRLLESIGNETNYVPPSGAIAGLMSRQDRVSGPWEPPANLPLKGVSGPRVGFTIRDLESLAGRLTGLIPINAIYAKPGSGTRLMGGRTLDPDSSEWRFFSVRRTFLMAHRDLHRFMQAYVFAPNNSITWIRLKATVEGYLQNLFDRGAFAGSTTSDAYFIQIGLGTTMTEQDILEGKMILEVGLAVARPAEFISVRLEQAQQE